ncbi:unnamed protein product, partial [Polarella glacialis]
NFSQNSSLLEDEESADPDLETQSLGGNSDDETESIAEAKSLAQEKFQWLTSHSLVSHRLDANAVAPADLQTNSSSASRRAAHVEADDATGSVRARSLPTQTPATDRRMAAAGSYRSASEYLAACSRYNLTPNGGALLCLSLGLSLLEVDGIMTNLELVPLCASQFMEQLREYRELASSHYKTRRFHEALNEHGQRREWWTWLKKCLLFLLTASLACLLFAFRPDWCLLGLEGVLVLAVLAAVGWSVLWLARLCSWSWPTAGGMWQRIRALGFKPKLASEVS